MLKKWFEITTIIGCPNNCVYCPQELLLKRYFENAPEAKKSLSLEDFKTILKKIPKYLQIDFAGMSEPFLNPEAVEMVLYAHKHGYEINVYSTLCGLSLEDIQRIKHIPFGEFCIHTPDADGVLKLPVDALYLEKIKLLRKSHINNLSFLVLGHRRQDIAKAAGQKIIVSALSCRGNSLNTREMPRNWRFMAKDFNNSTRIFCEKQLFSWIGRMPLPRMETWLMLPDGRVLLCCMDYGMKHVLGNLFDQSYEEILNGPTLKLIEKSMRREVSESLLCDSCDFAHNYSTLSFFIYRLTGIYSDSILRSMIRLPYFLIKKFF